MQRVVGHEKAGAVSNAAGAVSNAPGPWAHLALVHLLGDCPLVRLVLGHLVQSLLAAGG